MGLRKTGSKGSLGGDNERRVVIHAICTHDGPPAGDLPARPLTSRKRNQRSKRPRDPPKITVTAWKQDPGLGGGVLAISRIPSVLGTRCLSPLATVMSLRPLRNLSVPSFIIHSFVHPLFSLIPGTVLGKKDTWVRKTPTCFLADPGLSARRQTRPFRISVLEPLRVTARERHSPSVALELRRWRLKIREPAREGSSVRTESTGMGRGPLQGQ